MKERNCSKNISKNSIKHYRIRRRTTKGETLYRRLFQGVKVKLSAFFDFKQVSNLSADQAGLFKIRRRTTCRLTLPESSNMKSSIYNRKPIKSKITITFNIKPCEEVVSFSSYRWYHLGTVLKKKIPIVYLFSLFIKAFICSEVYPFTFNVFLLIIL